VNRIANHKKVECCVCHNRMEMLDLADEHPTCEDCEFDFVEVYIETGKVVEWDHTAWEEEDIDYAREADRDKSLSKGY